ncbi:Hpt domain-containing protein [Pedobacter sp. ok626]|uniref:hybrid sensor histidine kinase/response regulator n=1 Tax=Pedobacter sp. ok626 TaxID=1761882 RepID=UPI00088DFD34|nr:ATP-binding protein [Pedobacter sp. ok626]SDK70677.1 Hpt domain-containing protein [Pedobacter sp. ok626]
MSNKLQSRFFKAIKGKIIIALLLACFAMFMAWAVSKVAFKEMLTTVENITAPSERLRVVNAISRKIGALDQQQKKKAFNDPGNYNQLFKESRQLRLVLDTLAGLYTNDSTQLTRILTIKRLLRERDKQFINYLKVRERLVNSKSFSEQVKNLSALAAKSSEQADSTIVATEQKTSTTTIYPTEERPKGFFGKLFGKKRTNEEDNGVKIVNEEKVKRDTIALSAEARMTKKLEQSLKVIEKEQRIKNESFLNMEALLTDANNLLVSQMLDVLRKVESEVVAQIELNGIQAKNVVNTGINTISLIMLIFFFLTVLLLYFILTDITKSNKYRTELELAKDEAEYHGRAKQRFLSNMSHEIRTPLQSIIGYSEIIRKQEKPQRKDIEAIYHSSEHLLQIVNEVLDYNRIISGKFTFSEKSFDIEQLLNEVVSVMRAQAELKSLQLITEFELSGIKYVEGDPFRLKQILYNLLGNAIKFTIKGEVTLSAFFKRQGELLHFTFLVKDTGVGLSEDETKLIFNEFEQVSTLEDEELNLSGAGLGLTIIKSLIEQQGGRVYVKSKKGVGSVFTVYLTLRISSEPEYESKLIESPVYKGKVWVVDDDQLILDLCAVIFENHGIDAQFFNSPTQLLNAEWNNEVKYILMDMRMPEMSGITLCRLLREKIGNAVKIYAITAQVLPDERELLLKNGFDGLVMKPFKQEELLTIFYNQATTVVETDESAEIEIESVDLDLTALKKMTFNDDEQLKKILLRFSEDSLNDSDEIRDAVDKADQPRLRLLTHRLAGRIAQIGAKKLATAFRLMEMELGNKDLDPLKKPQIEALLTQLSQLLAQIKTSE